MPGYKYKFSFVMPVYNVEKYLAETVESILEQTLDFKENCEIIFVNDGSPDDSEAICLRFKRRFPDNVTYIKQDNAGPSAARNAGLNVAQGQYISLLDSDDKLSSNCLASVYDFFEKHGQEVDVVAIKQLFFGARHGEHPLNYKFASSRIVDLGVEFDHIQMSAASAFFKAEVFKRHRFDAAVGRYAEDSKLMGEILLDKQKYGVLADPVYYYRKRSDQASSLDSNLADKFWYMQTPSRAFGELLSHARKQTGTIPKFIQFMVMYDFQWRLTQPDQLVLSDTELKDYKKTLYSLLHEIDDDVIMAQRQITLPFKVFALTKSNNVNVQENLKKEGGTYYYKTTPVIDLGRHSPKLHIEILEISNTNLVIEGFLNGLLAGGQELLLHSGSQNVKVKPVSRPHHHPKFLGEPVMARYFFKAQIPLKAGMKIEGHISNQAQPLELVFHRLTRLNQHAIKAYRQYGRWILSRSRTTLKAETTSRLRRLKHELAYWPTLLRRLKFRVAQESFDDWAQYIRSTKAAGRINILDAAKRARWIFIVPKSVLSNVYIVGYRLLYFVARPFYRRPIWIVSDRINAADDNGEVFFAYLMQQPALNANAFFVISKKSPDYQRLKKYGRQVLDYHSIRYKLLFLLADKVISSEATNYVTNPFGDRLNGAMDLCGYDFVFLQHGIIRDDISSWLNRYHKNIKLFVTSARPEYESVIHGNYAYDETVVKLTGLPRYDLLDSQPKGKLILAPTWRADLASDINQKTGIRPYRPAFQHSDFYKFFQTLIDDERLIEALREHNMTGELYLHPSFQQQARDFKGNDRFVIKEMPYDYPALKRDGNLLVTDYSSVAFDFAYLGKPVIYAQFDEASYYKLNTSQRGYLSYETEGLGPVTYDYETTVEQVLKTLNAGCIMEPEYQKRLDKFFAYRDKNNCRRVYEAIVQMDNREIK